nr:immunoglobulin heavy chain junction region [Macaca mulatta]MOY19066.1 immunoglobulin heavy chain junction region [Macaca mulatta]MOY20157.1 immunoglobulin heavy chain junction region [Macaca mulatta]
CARDVYGRGIDYW